MEITEKTILEGIRINREIKELNDQLNEIKEQLREDAAQVVREEGQNSVEYVSRLGTVTVLFPSDRTVVDGTNEEMEVLKEDLGDLVFDVFFETKVRYSPSKNFKNSLDKLKNPQRKQVEDAIKTVPSTPRVTFPK